VAEELVECISKSDKSSSLSEVHISSSAVSSTKFSSSSEAAQEEEDDEDEKKTDDSPPLLFEGVSASADSESKSTAASRRASRSAKEHAGSCPGGRPSSAANETGSALIHTEFCCPAGEEHDAEESCRSELLASKLGPASGDE